MKTLEDFKSVELTNSNAIVGGAMELNDDPSESHDQGTSIHHDMGTSVSYDMGLSVHHDVGLSESMDAEQ